MQESYEKMEELNQEGKPGELYPIGKLVQDSFSVIKRDFKVLLEIALLSAVFSLMFGLFGVYDQVSSAGHSLILFKHPFLLLLSIAVGMVFPVAQIYAINKLSENSSVSLGESFKVAFQKYFSYLWVYVLTGLVVIGGFLLLVVPGIIFGVWFLFAKYVVILEDRRSTSALRRSKQLVQGNGWYVFVIYFVLSIIFLASARISTGVLCAILYPIAGLPLNYQSFFFLSPAHQLFYTLLYVFVALSAIPLEASFLLLFKNLREIKGDSVVSVPYRFRAGERASTVK